MFKNSVKIELLTCENHETLLKLNYYKGWRSQLSRSCLDQESRSRHLENVSRDFLDTLKKYFSAVGKRTFRQILTKSML